MYMNMEKILEAQRAERYGRGIGGIRDVDVSSVDSDFTEQIPEIHVIRLSRRGKRQYVVL